jgi:hypothetical protein
VFTSASYLKLQPEIEQSENICQARTIIDASNALTARILRMNDDTLYSMNEFKRTIATILQRLRGLAPTAIENGVGSGNARGGGRILASHDADENTYGGSAVAPRD